MRMSSQGRLQQGSRCNSVSRNVGTAPKAQRRPRSLRQGVASCNRGQTASDGLAKRGGRRGNGSRTGLRPCHGLAAFVARHGDGPSGHITCECSLALCHISGDTLSRRLLRRQSRDGDRRFLLLLDPNLAQRRCDGSGTAGEIILFLDFVDASCCVVRLRGPLIADTAIKSRTSEDV
jgi:hypothetical protein